MLKNQLFIVSKSLVKAVLHRKLSYIVNRAVSNNDEMKSSSVIKLKNVAVLYYTTIQYVMVRLVQQKSIVMPTGALQNML